MIFLSLSFVAVAILYGLERLYFAKKFGFFAAIFWVFAFQFGVLFAGEVILENRLGQSLPDWIKAAGLKIGLLAYLTIGMTPIAAGLAALAIGIAMAAKSFGRTPREN